MGARARAHRHPDPGRLAAREHHRLGEGGRSGPHRSRSGETVRVTEGPRWADVEGYLAKTVAGEDEILASIRARTVEAGLHPIEVSTTDGALLALWCRLIGATRVLEIGALGGYSATWFARAVGERGSVTTLELDPRAAAVAQENWRLAGVADRVEVLVGQAVDTLTSLIGASAEPYDLVFIDADKKNNPTYLEAALALTRPGSLIVCLLYTSD